MKTKIVLTVFASFAATALASAATNDVATFLQRGLFEEEANHQLDAAIGDYKEAIGHFDSERQLAATAIFRLGECYRKLGRTNEANAQYERIVREFPDQTQLAQLSRNYLPSGVSSSSAAPAAALPSAEEEFLRLAKQIVQNSPDLVNQKFFEAVNHGYVLAAEFLIARGANVNTINKDQQAIIDATRGGNEAMVQLLLSHGAAVNSDSNGKTALYWAVQKGFTAICQTLIAHEADVNLSSPIVMAAMQGNEAIVQLLLSHGAAVDSRNGDGRTALSYAAENGYLILCQTLVAHGADVNAKDNHDVTPLLSAVARGFLSTAEFLITSKAQIDFSTTNEIRPLLQAIGSGNIDMVKLLLNNHADANMKTESPYGRYSPLLWAITHKSTPTLEIIQLLFDHGAKPDTVDPRGVTVLALAVQSGYMDVVRELIAHGADVNMPDKYGQPPLAYINSPLTETGRQIEALLIKAGADLDYNRRRGIWIGDSEGKTKTTIFWCPTNSINHYTLLESLATHYKVSAPASTNFQNGISTNGRYIESPYVERGNMVLFPDFTRVTINRLDGKSAEILHVNIEDILQSSDCSKDVALKAGDMVEIATQEHKVAEEWHGLSGQELAALDKCLLRIVRIIARGHTNDIALTPCIADPAVTQRNTEKPHYSFLDMRSGWLVEALKGRKADTVVQSFLLNKVVRDVNVLLNTWDLSRVRLTRGGAKMTFDLTAKTPPGVWLEDGDVIEIPEIGEGAPDKKN